jgi:hypothetical protein
VVYVLGEPLRTAATVEAVIDPQGRVDDRNRANNAKAEALAPR